MVKGWSPRILSPSDAQNLMDGVPIIDGVPIFDAENWTVREGKAVMGDGRIFLTTKDRDAVLALATLT